MIISSTLISLGSINRTFAKLRLASITFSVSSSKIINTFLSWSSKLFNALSYKNKNKNIVVVDNFNLESNKTKDIKTLYNDLKLSGKVLFVADEDADKLYLATRNIPTALVLFADELNVYDVVDADYVVIDEKSLAQIEEVLK